MEKISDIVKRVLKGENCFCEEKDYLSLWDEIIPKEIRRHARVTVKDKNLFVWVDNPTTHHHLFLQKEKIAGEFRRNKLEIKEIKIKQAAGQTVSPTKKARK